MLTAGPGTALLLDAAGTLLRPAEPIAETYARIARTHGVASEAAVISSRFRAAMAEAAAARDPRDWRPFWATVVARCVGSDDAALLDELIDHFARPAAWIVAPGAEACCVRVRERGMLVAVVSNWDQRLRPLLVGLGVSAWIDELVISAEEGVEKPDPAIFWRACERLGVAPADAVHVGDDPELDVAGAKAAGCVGLLLGGDVADFDALARVLLG